MSPRLVLWLGLSLALWVWGGANSQTVPHLDVWLLLLAMGVGLEMTAVRLPEAAYASLGVGAYAAAFLFCGWGPAVVLAGVALAVRTLARGGGSAGVRLYELSMDSLTVLPSLVVAGLAGPYPGLVAYWFSTRAMPWRTCP